MSPLERISRMMHVAHTAERIFPPTIFYNEGWLLRLVLDVLSTQHSERDVLAFEPGSRWFSEALLPSQFLARRRRDPLAEGWTHADGIIGHFLIGTTAFANATLARGATQFVVTEAKLFSLLSPRVTNASYFDQAARNVACIAEVLANAERQPKDFSSLGFYVIAPSERIKLNLFRSALTKQSIQAKVERRVSEYEPPDREKKEAWLRDWFLPTLDCVDIECLSWEQIIDDLRSGDECFRKELSNFYSQCLRFNSPQEPELTGILSLPDSK
jgi:hypothetical protein